MITVNPEVGSFRRQGVHVCVYINTCLFALSLKGGGQHLREEFEEDRKKELHERNDDKHHKGHQTEQVSAGPHQLSTQRRTMLMSENVEGNMSQCSRHCAVVYRGVFACKIHYMCAETLPVLF